MASEDVQPLVDNSSRSDWFRQTVLYWSSQTGNCDSSEQTHENTNSEITSDFSSTESTCSLSANNTFEERHSEGDYLLDLDITTSELLKQVEEFEHCFSELTKSDDSHQPKAASERKQIPDDDSYYSTLESVTQSPHLTLEFPAGSSIRDSPLYTIGDTSPELNNKTVGSAEYMAGKEKLKEEGTDKSSACNVPHQADTVSKDTKNSVSINDTDSDQRGDPNVILRDMLSGIKPPNGVCMDITSSQDVTRKECTKPHKSNENLVLPDNSKHVDKRIEAPVKQVNDSSLPEHKKYADASPVKRKSIKKSHEKLDVTSSDSNSPYPSPMVHRSPPSSDKGHQKTPGYDSGYVEQPTKNKTETIYESPKENIWDFPDDSDLSSDWSPLSTIDSADFSVASSKRIRSLSAPHNSQFSSPGHNRRTSTGNMSNQKKRANSTAVSYPRFDGAPSSDNVYSESELSAIRKFLTLTRKYFDKGSDMCSKESGACLDRLAMIPNINEIVEAQSKEVSEQREMLEGFIRQLGELLIEIVNLKDEQTSVRTKQAKALTLLKKQLDHQKKNQSQACTDILTQVNVLHEKLNSTLSTEQLCSTPISKNGSVKSNSSTKLQSAGVKPSNSKSHLSTASNNSTLSLNTSLNARPSNYGQIIWKITDVMRKITRIKSGVIDGTLVSSPFQTGEYQYNMNAWVYLNGRGKMVGKFVSVYACVLVGEYDAILSWPVTPTYRFTLIDQRSDPSKRQDHVRVRRVLDIAGRGENVISQNGGIPRPSDGSKALIVGLDDFIAHDQLLKNRYLVDDVIFLKVEAEIS